MFLKFFGCMDFCVCVCVGVFVFLRPNLQKKTSALYPPQTPNPPPAAGPVFRAFNSPISAVKFTISSSSSSLVSLFYSHADKQAVCALVAHVERLVFTSEYRLFKKRRKSKRWEAAGGVEVWLVWWFLVWF